MPLPPPSSTTTAALVTGASAGIDAHIARTPAGPRSQPRCRPGFADAAGVSEVFDRSSQAMIVSSAEVARQAVEGPAANHRVVVPGAAVKVLGVLSRLTPNAVLAPLLQRFYPD